MFNPKRDPSQSPLKLYDYFRSSASFRVRICLNLKNIAYDQIPIHLLHEGGEHKKEEYLSLNPQGLVPALGFSNTLLTQSLAICEYLEEAYPLPALLPIDPIDRAKVRSLCLQIACDIHPLNNLRVLQYLKEQLKVSETEQKSWYQHWITLGFNALEQFLSKNSLSGEFCFGESATLADVCLVPQYYNALRYECSMEAYPTIDRIAQSCLKIPAFSKALP